MKIFFYSFTFIIVILLNFSLLAKVKSSKTTKNVRNPNQDVPTYQVQARDESVEKFLKSSSISQHSVEPDAEQKAFQRKAYFAYQKVAGLLPKKNFDQLGFIYDCLFMVEEGFSLKYSSSSKQNFEKARRIVLEVFEK